MLNYLISHDCSSYDMSMITFTIYKKPKSSSCSALNWFKKYKPCSVTDVVKIVKEFDDQYIIKFMEPYMLNNDPKNLSLYAILGKNNGEIYHVPIEGTYIEMEFCELNKMDLSGYIKLSDKWTSVFLRLCDVCHKKIVNKCGFCCSIHQLCCSECADKCSICSEKKLFSLFKFI